MRASSGGVSVRAFGRDGTGHCSTRSVLAFPPLTSRWHVSFEILEGPQVFRTCENVGVCNNHGFLTPNSFQPIFDTYTEHSSDDLRSDQNQRLETMQSGTHNTQKFKWWQAVESQVTFQVDRNHFSSGDKESSVNGSDNVKQTCDCACSHTPDSSLLVSQHPQTPLIQTKQRVIMMTSCTCDKHFFGADPTRLKKHIIIVG